MTKQLSTAHLNQALDLAASRGLQAKDITSVHVGDDGRVFSLGAGSDRDGMARFIGRASFGL